MSKLIAIMSMSLDGFVADRNDDVGEVFDGTSRQETSKSTPQVRMP